LIGKIIKKISFMLPIMATAKKNHRNPTKIGFLGTPRKTDIGSFKEQTTQK
jgi:hypothetical protein